MNSILLHAQEIKRNSLVSSTQMASEVSRPTSQNGDDVGVAVVEVDVFMKHLLKRFIVDVDCRETFRQTLLQPAERRPRVHGAAIPLTRDGCVASTKHALQQERKFPRRRQQGVDARHE